MRIRKRLSIFKFVLLSTLLVSFIGCAVMTVDVDVYKGPMSNHEEVQMQQLASMAVGAKPLLVRLRDGLEWKKKELMMIKNTGDLSYVKRDVKYKGNIYRDNTNINIKYKDSYIGDGYTFKNETAKAVNDILSLYDDNKHIKNASLSSGRLANGLETLIKEYLISDSNRRDYNEKIYPEQNKLANAVVRFAEKVLVLTNNEALLGDQQIFGDGIGFIGNEKFRYTTLLQSIGNSILIQADELRHRESHDKMLKEKVDSEVLALNHVLFRSPEQVINSRINGLQSIVESNNKDIERERKHKESINKEISAITGKIHLLTTEIEAATTNRNELNKTDKELGKLKSTLKEKEKQKNELNKDLTEKNNKLRGLDLLIAKIGTETVQHEDAVEMVIENKAKVIQELYKAPKTPGSSLISVAEPEQDAKALNISPSAVANKIKQIINTELKNETEDSERFKKLENTILVLNNLKHPMDSFSIEDALGLNDKDKKDKIDAKDILDTLITVLRNEHILAIEEGDNGFAKNIEKALAAAYEHRSGLVYIRPPSAYLRSSYPVTTFQDSPQLGWNNMLTDRAIKGLPLISDLFATGNRVGSRQEVREEVDKQFWHNINRVRVSGGGRTNYVVAKDDVGNWYVKSYSTDPQDIIRSAKSLAMFNLSGSMGVDMISRLRQYTSEQAGESTGSDKKSDSSLSNIETLYVKYVNSFNQQAKSDYNLFLNTLNEKEIEKKIKKSAESIEYITKTEGVKTAIDNNVDIVSENMLDPVAKDLKNAENIDDKNTVAKLSGTVIDLLYSTIRFHNELIYKIKSGNLVTSKAKTNLTASKTAKKQEEENLTAAIDSTKKAKKEYSETLEAYEKKIDEVNDLELKSKEYKKLVSNAERAATEATRIANEANNAARNANTANTKAESANARANETADRANDNANKANAAAAIANTTNTNAAAKATTASATANAANDAAADALAAFNAANDANAIAASKAAKIVLDNANERVRIANESARIEATAAAAAATAANTANKKADKANDDARIASTKVVKANAEASEARANATNAKGAAHAANAASVSANESLASLKELQTKVNSKLIKAEDERDALDTEMDKKKAKVKAEEMKVSESDEKLKELSKAVTESESELEKAKGAEEILVDGITRIIHDEVAKIYNLRKDSVNDYEKAIMFIADAVNPDSKPPVDPDDEERSLSQREEIANELQINVQNAFEELGNSGNVLETVRGRIGNRQGRGTRLNTLSGVLSPVNRGQ